MEEDDSFKYDDCESKILIVPVTIQHTADEIREMTVSVSASRLTKQAKCNKIMEGLQFAQPIGLENHPVIKR
jgi:hypothetical protein